MLVYLTGGGGGKIPKHWELIRGAFIFSSKKELNANLQCKERLALTLNGVIEKDINQNDGLNPLDFSTYQIFEKNNLVFKLIDLENINTSRVGYVYKKGIMSSAYIRLIINGENYAKFFYYYYLSLYNNQVFNKLGTGVRATLSVDDLLNLKIPLPPLKEQKEIAEFLDKKCEKIANFITHKQKLITLLQEKKQALINETVTKGLNPKAKFKASGIDYLGTIPKHWEVKKLKHICKINPQANETLPNNFIYIDLESVIKGQLLKEQVINKEQAPSRAQRILQKQDILFQLVRPYQRNNYIFNKNGDYVASTGYAQIRTKECVNFVYYTLLENSFVERVILKSTGSNYPAITSNDFADLKIPLPPLQEQKEIAKFLDAKIAQIDLAIEKTKKQITLIKEYKNTLISEAVCGRIKLNKRK